MQVLVQMSRFEPNASLACFVASGGFEPKVDAPSTGETTQLDASMAGCPILIARGSSNGFATFCGDLLEVAAAVVSLLVILSRPVMDCLLALWEGLPWWVGLLLLLFLAAYVLLRAGYELWKEEEQARRELADENEELIAELEAQSSAVSASWEEWDKTPLTPIEGKTYRNELVSLDGFYYIDCTFINPTFVYKGEKPFRFKNPTIQGSLNLDARTPPLQLLLRLLRDGHAIHPEVTQYMFDD